MEVSDNFSDKINYILNGYYNYLIKNVIWHFDIEELTLIFNNIEFDIIATGLYNFNE